MKKLLLFLLILIVAITAWVWKRKNEPPAVRMAKVKRETLVSSLQTNGKVEPIQWEAVRSEAAGVVEKVPVQEGQQVAQDAVLAQLSQTGLQADLTAAQARVTEAQAGLATIAAGGKSAELVVIENSLAKARLEREAALRDYNSLRKLADKQAATPVEVQAARGKLQEAELEIEGLEKRRAALVSKNDRAVAEARLKDAEAALQLARAHLAQTVIHAPISGAIYGLAVRPGAYVKPGDLIANVGRLDQVRVRVYVDEPELGRIAAGQAVDITWDALPGRHWQGTVERLPSNIIALAGSGRQVGEVLCTIDNPRRELVPGTNVNAEIRTSVALNALTIPKEALRASGAAAAVFVLQGDQLRLRRVQTGAASITRVAITQGLQEGDAVALPTDQPLRDGERIRPVYVP